MSSIYQHTTNPEGLSNIPTGVMEKHRAAPAASGPIGMNFDHPSTLQGALGHGINMMPAKQMLVTPSPHLQPLNNNGKVQLEVIPSNGITRSQRTAQGKSPCHELPCYLVPNNFIAKQPQYSTVQTSVETALQMMCEKYPGSLDYGYFSSQCQWRLKYLNGSDLREIHINCYWDSNIQDHVIEMNRVKGDGLFPSTNEFYEILRQKVLGEHYTPPKVIPGRRPMMAGPPPLLLKRSSGSSGLPILPSVTEEMFLKGIKPIFAMAEDNYFEPRLEAAKALCDMSKRDRKMLLLSSCQQNIINCLNLLLQDEFDDIKQFAVMACSLFAANPDYQTLLANMPSIHVLVKLVLEAPLHEEIAFETAQIRRKACLALNMMAIENSNKIRTCLEEHGITNANQLKQRCVNHLPDALVSELESCFDN